MSTFTTYTLLSSALVGSGVILRAPSFSSEMNNTSPFWIPVFFAQFMGMETERVEYPTFCTFLGSKFFT